MIENPHEGSGTLEGSVEMTPGNFLSRPSGMSGILTRILARQRVILGGQVVEFRSFSEPGEDAMIMTPTGAMVMDLLRTKETMIMEASYRMIGGPLGIVPDLSRLDRSRCQGCRTLEARVQALEDRLARQDREEHLRARARRLGILLP